MIMLWNSGISILGFSILYYRIDWPRGLIIACLVVLTSSGPGGSLDLWYDSFKSILLKASS